MSNEERKSPALHAGDPAPADRAAERSELIEHLHTHPDHAGRYPAGHDFVLVSTVDIRRAHQRQHGEEGPS